jgi:putative transposase
MRLTTLQYRIKDETTAKHLNKMAGAVNFVWNYCNEINRDRYAKFYKTYSRFDLHRMTAGCSVDLGIHSETIGAVADEITKKRLQHKKVKLSWRSKKRNLGWIPFKEGNIKINGDKVIYYGHNFRIWLSRPIEGNVRSGSFSQDSKGHWYINLVIQDCDRFRISTRKQVGIDLGLKTIATLSDGNELNRDNLTKKYENQLAIAQRAGKKRRVTAIHTKIKNKRKDWNHKKTTELVKNYDRLIVGDVDSSKLIKTGMAKSVHDAGWGQFKTMLTYKAIALGVEVKVVKENFSTVTCSLCKERTGPKGLSGLGVRQWQCSNCGESHNRDVNAAKNILSSVQGIVRQRESINIMEDVNASFTLSVG